MKYQVRRTNSYEGQPCPEAYEDAYIRFDVRTADDPAKIPRHRNQPTDWWYSEGRNHRVEHGRIVRDFDARGWFVDINSLEELMAFYQRHGRIIIFPSWDNYTIPCIEIYDDYRE